MIIFGAGGHALEILDELNVDCLKDGVCFFDDFDRSKTDFFGFRIVSEALEVSELIANDSRCIVGVGTPKNRKIVSDKILSFGGDLCEIISKDARIGGYNVEIGAGVNIMSGVRISSDVKIGDLTLVNRNTITHHGVVIGNNCDIAPNVTLLGNVKIGDNCFVGAGTIVLPGFSIGEGCVIGAGTVVNCNIESNQFVVGVPCKTRNL